MIVSINTEKFRDKENNKPVVFRTENSQSIVPRIIPYQEIQRVEERAITVEKSLKTVLFTQTVVTYMLSPVI